MSQTLDGWPEQERPAEVERESRLPLLGVVAGLLMPIIGLVIAIVLFMRGQVGPGLAACLASFLGFIGAILFL